MIAHGVHVVFTVDAATDDEARQAVHAQLREAQDAAPGDNTGPQVRSWLVDEALVPEVWWRFADTPIPEIIGGMFPPEPEREAFRNSDGELDFDAYDDVADRWRDRCLSLAVDAARLPQLLERLRRAEHVRDGLLDVLERHPLPDGPAGWEEFQDAAIARDLALHALMAHGGERTAYLPVEFYQEWVPADLLAVTTLRKLLSESPADRLLAHEERQQLRSMLSAADPEVRIPDPDDPSGPELYEGPASEAVWWIPPGVYPATGTDGQGEFRVVVGPSRVGDVTMASAAFPPAEQDSMVLNQIAGVLEDAGERGNIGQVLARIDGLVAGTGRVTGGGETLIERGALLSELLADRERQVRPDPGGTQHPDHTEGPDLDR